MGAETTDRADLTASDPRPRAATRDGVVVLAGWRCPGCALPRATPSPRCPDCGSALDAAEFGPEGTVWSSTIVHLELDGLEPPYGLAYVDLDGGPRVLAHTPDASAPIPVGTRVALSGTTARGDIRIAPVERESST